MLTTSLHRCPSCGYLVEMFSDEQTVRCPRCDARVSREAAPSCVQWCSSARACLGEERWNALFGAASERCPDEPDPPERT